MPLKRADTSKTKRFVRGEDEEWIDGNETLGILPHPDDRGDDSWVEFRTAFSKHDDAVINDSTGFERISTEEGLVLRGKAASGDPKVFALLAVAWSLEEGKPKREDYEALDAADAAWIDRCLTQAVQIARGEVTGNSSSPRTAEPQSNGPDSSPVAAAPQ